MMHNVKRRILSAALAVCMLAGTMTASAYATESDAIVGNTVVDNADTGSTNTEMPTDPDTTSDTETSNGTGATNGETDATNGGTDVTTDDPDTPSLETETTTEAGTGATNGETDVTTDEAGTPPTGTDVTTDETDTPPTETGATNGGTDVQTGDTDTPPTETGATNGETDVTNDDPGTITDTELTDSSVEGDISLLTTEEETGTTESTTETTYMVKQPNGTGTEDDPYQISTADELYWFAGLVNGTLTDGTQQNAAACAVLMADITVNEPSVVEAAYAEFVNGGSTSADDGTEALAEGTTEMESSSPREWRAIRSYTGDFNGKGYKIIGIWSMNAGGIFGHFSGTVSDLSVENAYIISEVEDVIYSTVNVGGIANILENGTIKNCSFNGIIKNGSHVGGIVGYIENGEVRNCTTSGTIQATDGTARDVGGIVGFSHDSGIIMQCINYAEISISNIQTSGSTVGVGGITGTVQKTLLGMCSNDGKIFITTGEVTDTYLEIGGVAGYVLGDGAVIGSYNTADITLGDFFEAAGGVVGKQLGAVYKCYNTGNITSSVQIETKGNSDSNYIGGVIGLQTLYDTCKVDKCFYLAEMAQNAIGCSEDEPLPTALSYAETQETVVLEDFFGLSGMTSGECQEKDGNAFASGEVAWLLNEESSEEPLFYQNLSETDGDPIPVLDSSHGVVYAIGKKGCPGCATLSEITGYNNISAEVVVGDHDYTSTTPCTYCGAFSSEYSISYIENDSIRYYELDSANDLYWFAAWVNGDIDGTIHPDSNAVLTANISIQGEGISVLADDGNLVDDTASLRSWTPIGFDLDNTNKEFSEQNKDYYVDYSSILQAYYSGTFDGQGYTISGLYAEYTDVCGVGLFGVVAPDAEIRNVKVEDTYFHGIASVSNSSGIYGWGGIAGAVRSPQGDLSPAWKEPNEIGEFPSSDMFSYETVFWNCSFAGTVVAQGANGVGGIIGDGYSNLYIGNCYNLGIVVNEGDSIGGLVGLGAQIYIENSYNLGNISGYGCVGGIAGLLYPADLNSSEETYSAYFNSCYNAGSVAGDLSITGAIVGGLYTDYCCSQNCYYLTSDYSGIGSDQSSSSSYDYKIAPIEKTAEEFSSGEVTYLLNHSGEGLRMWYQTLSSDNGIADPYPVLDSSHGIVIFDGTNYSNATEEMPSYIITVTSCLADSSVTVSTVSGGGRYSQGESVTVKAPVKTNFRFLGWYESLENGGYSSVLQSSNSNYTFTAESDRNLVAVYVPKSGTVHLNIEGTGYTVKVGDEEPVPAGTAGYSKGIAVGQGVTVTYTGSGNFYFWQNDFEKILSRESTYSFTIMGDTYLKPVYAEAGSADGNAAFVEFVSNSGQVMQAGTYTVEDTITFPVGPASYEGEFLYWSLDGTNEATSDSIVSEIRKGNQRITVKPVYQLDEASSRTLKIGMHLIENGKIIDLGTFDRITTAISNGLHQITPPTEDEWGDHAEALMNAKIVGWGHSGSIFSYQETCTFLFYDSVVEIDVYYSAHAEDMAPKPVIELTGYRDFAEDGREKSWFVYAREVPEGYTLKEHGALLDTSGEILQLHPSEDDDKELKAAILNGTDNLIRFKSSDLSRQGFFVATVVRGNANGTVGGANNSVKSRGYMIVTNNSTGEDEVILSNYVSPNYM